jgi:beta-xylosidase
MCRRPIFRSSFLLLVLLFASLAQASPWVADQGDGTYRNPILYADYSDPDVIRVGTDFYLTASSFNAVPGLPILHSKDLVNWELIGHVYAAQPPLDVYNKPQHGSGSWAPALRYHNGQFYIFYPDPGYGIYMKGVQAGRSEVSGNTVYGFADIDWFRIE